MRAFLAAIVLTACSSGVWARAQSPKVADLLTRYLQRDPAIAQAFASPIDLDAARKELDRVGPKFLDAEPFDARRRVLVSFVLELAQSHSEKQSLAATALVEWACRYVRRHNPPDEFDLRWQLTATALLEGAINPALLETHLRHIAEQFPDEPRFALGRALIAEQRTAPREVMRRSAAPPAAPTSSSSRTTAPSLEWFREEAARRFQELALAVPAVRAEADVRRAHVHLELGRYDDALTALEGVESLTRDPALVYLSRLFRAQSLDALKRTDEAQAAFRAALEVGPGAQSATMGLADVLFRHGDRLEADRLVAALLVHNDPRVDPWWSYWAGDYRFWFPLINGLREMLP